VKLHDGSFQILLRNAAVGSTPGSGYPPSAAFANFDTGFGASPTSTATAADLVRIVFASDSMQEGHRSCLAMHRNALHVVDIAAGSCSGQ
jgi:hypothetical protein